MRPILIYDRIISYKAKTSPRCFVFFNLKNMPIEITKLSLSELKALAYDLIIQRDNVQVNLNAVNQEILKRPEDGKK